MREWKKITYTFDWLVAQARGLTHRQSAVEWLRDIEVIPDDAAVNKKLGFRIQPANKITGESIAAFARDFDEEGEGSPEEFMQAFAFEVGGTRQRAIVSEMMSALGKDEQP